MRSNNKSWTEFPTSIQYLKIIRMQDQNVPTQIDFDNSAKNFHQKCWEYNKELTDRTTAKYYVHQKTNIHL